MKKIVEVLMRRDGLSMDEAMGQVVEAKVQLREYLDERNMEGAENICQEFFGLELYYLWELM